MTIAAGSIGPYRIVGRLGAGGMGEVYLAHDARLERDVALKVLPPGLIGDPDQLARFRREAITLASLNHPNIATLHGLEEAPGGALVLVLERVEGESLAQRLARGAMSVDEALQVGAQIATALEVAHERGIVHRDVKPGNVMIGPRGLVKVLDFGLAKRSGGLLGLHGGARPAPAGERAPAARPGAAAVPAVALPMPPGGFAELPSLGPGAPPALASGDAPTLAVPAAAASAGADAPTIAAGIGPGPATEFGTVVGTPGYMSPEQVLAGEQDARTDVFAFGCVLYECLSGARAFPANDPFTAIAAVLNETPDLERLPARVPAAVRAIVRRCLEKEVASRPASMREVRVVLEEALGIRRATALREGEAVATPHNLPAPSTSFVGRDAERTACDDLFAHTRLLTLTGIGGSGKTRLALHLAGSRLDAFPDGVWFVDLAPLDAPSRVLDVLAAVLQVHDEPGHALLDLVTAHLARRRVLLVVDNCEDLLEATGRLLAHLLRGAPELRVLATSREPLGIAGETAYAVPPLAVPARGRGADPGALAGFESVRLFVERAAQAQPGFELTAANAGAVAEVCRRLDGIPLAIELAAARVRMLSIEQIRDRLDDRFRLLTSGGRGASGRQQTLLATLQWSWDHLAEPEQELMRNLSVFVGGWTLERATRVAGDRADEFEVLDLLTRLVERSLVVVERADGSARYRFLESVLRFALDRLTGSGGETAARGRHLDVFADLAREFENGVNGARMDEWVAELAREHENLLAALAWCDHAQDGARRGLEIASSASRFWSLRGQYALGRQVLLDALARDAAAAPTAARAVALARAGGFSLVRGDWAEARAWVEQSLGVCRALGDRRGIARALSGLSVVATYMSDLDAAYAAGEEGLALYAGLGLERGMGLARHNLATIEWLRGNFEASRALFEQALPLIERSGDTANQALCLAALGQTLLDLGRIPEAREHLVRCVALIRKVGSPREAAFAGESTAEYALRTGSAALAARLLAGAQAARTSIGSPHLPLERKWMDQLQDRVRDAIGGPAYEAARLEGAGWDTARLLDETERALVASPAGR